jgi:hypothetical protein
LGPSLPAVALPDTAAAPTSPAATTVARMGLVAFMPASIASASQPETDDLWVV